MKNYPFQKCNWNFYGFISRHEQSWAACDHSTRKLNQFSEHLNWAYSCGIGAGRQAEIYSKSPTTAAERQTKKNKKPTETQNFKFGSPNSKT